MDKEYLKLTELFTDDIFNNTEKQTTSAYVQQNKDQEQILNMVAKVLLSYTIIDSALALGNNDKKALTNKFNITISDVTKGQFSGEKSLMDDILTTAAKDKYYTDAYITQMGIDFNLQKITDDEIAKVLNSSIDNKLWSDRLWDNKKDLENKLKKEVDSFLKGKTNVNQIEKSVKKRFNQNAYNTHRLVQTEVARCQSEANDIFADNHDVEYQLYTATLDTKTSDFCREHDGRTYKIDDLNKPYLPAHPFCRSCFINLPDKDWKPNLRRDQENNKIVDWTTYQDWYDENIKNNPEALIKEFSIKNKYADKKSFEDYKKVLGKDASKTLEDFQKLKYNNSDEWNKLKGSYRKINAYNKIIANEPEITKDLQDISKATKTKMVGLDYRLKTKESYLRKVGTDSENSIDSKIIDDTVKSTNDVIRYTYQTSADKLVDKYFEVSKKLRDKGYSEIRVKNFWINKRSSYKGVNCIFEHSNGQKFEVQFHTPESSELKNGELHKLYEEARLDGITPERKTELEKKMFQLSLDLIEPVNITKIQPRR